MQAIRHRIDVATLAPELASTIAAGEIASVTLRAHELIAVDDFAAMPATGRFVLRDAYVTVGGGIIDASGYPDHRAMPERARNLTPMRHQVTETERASALRARRSGRLAHRLVGGGQVDAGDGAGATPVRWRLRDVRARRRQRAARLERQPGFLARGSAGKHPSRRRGSGAVRRSRIRLHHRVHLTLSRRPARERGPPSPRGVSSRSMSGPT